MRALIALLLPLSLTLACSNSRKLERLTPVDEQTAAPATARPLLLQSTPAEDGRQIFLGNCIGCHGKNADGNTPAGRAWHVPDLHSLEVQARSDQQLLDIIRNGKGKMPAWSGLLSSIDIDHVLTYVRALDQRPSERPHP
jgi:mono/diheme cytochrome c family protein